MACAEHEPITGVWELCPQRGPGAELSILPDLSVEFITYFISLREYRPIRLRALNFTQRTQRNLLRCVRCMRCVARNARSALALNYTQGPWLRCLSCVRCVRLETGLNAKF